MHIKFNDLKNKMKIEREEKEETENNKLNDAVIEANSKVNKSSLDMINIRNDENENGYFAPYIKIKDSKF